MKRGQVTQFIIAGLIILILLINGNVNADKKGCEKATDLAEQSAKNNIEGYKEKLPDLSIETYINPNEMTIIKGGIKEKLQSGSIRVLRVYDIDTGKIKIVQVVGGERGMVPISQTGEVFRYFEPNIIDKGSSKILKNSDPIKLVNGFRSNGIAAKNIGKVNLYGSKYNLIVIEESSNVKKITGNSKKVYYVVNNEGNLAIVNEKIIRIIKEQNKNIIIP